jgi:LytS/YehU family sensor histidine kinase
VWHVLSAALMTSFWLLVGVLYSEILGDLSGNPVWREMYDRTLPLLLATGLFLYFTFALIYYMVLALEKGRQAEQKALENLLSARSAELSSLRSSIHPHFLFNSLTSLSTLTRKSPELAQEIILQLADFLRYSLNYGQQVWVRIKDEMDHIEDYLGIEKIRLGGRLNYEFSVEPETQGALLPPFTLLPLVENGLKKRLENAYKGEAGLSVSKNDESFKVTLRLPLKEVDDSL